jgi:hypothetical protein
MATSDQEQKSINVPMHKRLAQGEKLDGTSLKGSGGKEKAKGALDHAKKSK